MMRRKQTLYSLRTYFGRSKIERTDELIRRGLTVRLEDLETGAAVFEVPMLRYGREYWAIEAENAQFELNRVDNLHIVEGGRLILDGDNPLPNARLLAARGFHVTRIGIRW